MYTVRTLMIHLLKSLETYTYTDIDKLNIAQFLLNTFPYDYNGVYMFLCDFDAPEWHLDFVEPIMKGIFTDMIKHFNGIDIIWSEYEIALIAYIFDTNTRFFEISLPAHGIRPYDEDVLCKKMWKYVGRSFAIPDNWFNTHLC